MRNLEREQLLRELTVVTTELLARLDLIATELDALRAMMKQPQNSSRLLRAFERLKHDLATALHRYD